MTPCHIAEDYNSQNAVRFSGALSSLRRKKRGDPLGLLQGWWVRVVLEEDPVLYSLPTHVPVTKAWIQEGL